MTSRRVTQDRNFGKLKSARSGPGLDRITEQHRLECGPSTQEFVTSEWVKQEIAVLARDNPADKDLIEDFDGYVLERRKRWVRYKNKEALLDASASVPPPSLSGASLDVHDLSNDMCVCSPNIFCMLH